MSVTVNDKELHGFWAWVVWIFVGLPLAIVCIFAFFILMILTLVLLALLSPFIVIGLIIVAVVGALSD